MVSGNKEKNREGTALFDKEDYKGSQRCWEDLLSRYMNGADTELQIKIRINIASARYMAARHEVRQGRYDRAIELLNDFRRQYPGDKRAGEIVDRLGKLADDVENVKECLAAAGANILADRWSEASDRLLDVLKK